MVALFIHRSVGQHLMEQGELRVLLNEKDVNLDDYDNNSGILTHNNGNLEKDAMSMAGDNTNPSNFAEFFSQWPELLNGYDLIMIKSCYPNSHIGDEALLSEIKKSYKSIIKSFSDHNARLLILTSPPLRPLFTNQTEARLSGELADWLVSETNDNVQVFDLHHALSENSGRHRGMLKREFRRFVPFDNHPNKKAHQLIAPRIAELLVAS